MPQFFTMLCRKSKCVLIFIDNGTFSSFPYCLNSYIVLFLLITIKVRSEFLPGRDLILVGSTETSVIRGLWLIMNHPVSKLSGEVNFSLADLGRNECAYECMHTS